ncbi:MAG: hypothetical protein UHX00_01660 [Caryophanon sp.]|nr:hypothetical protein [Caryophanon sp.]
MDLHELRNMFDMEGAASPIIKKIVYAYLKNHSGQPISLKELKGLVENETKKEFSNGSFSGAMRDLIEESDGRIVNVERGYYVYLKDYKVYQILSAIDEFLEELDAIAIDNILELTDQDIQTIKLIPTIKNEIEIIAGQLAKRITHKK